MNELQQKQLAFLEETVNHYNSNNRCSEDEYGVSCRYSPITLGLEGKSEGCAIGRKLTPELARTIDLKYGSGGVKTVVSDLPQELIELEIGFLQDIQGLHDAASNWIETGLSQRGQIEVNKIKESYGFIETPTTHTEEKRK